MKIKGMGYAILRVTESQLRELHKIPEDVKFVKTLEACGRSWERYDPSWYHDEHPYYFQIQHRYLPRAGDRAALIVFHLGELLKQYADVAEQEKLYAGKPMEEAFEGG